jgi:hypothetical protein
LASSQRWGSPLPCDSSQRRPAARSIEPSARHAFRQSLPAMSSSRCDDSTSRDALWMATERLVALLAAPPFGCAGAGAGVADAPGVLGATSELGGGGGAGAGAYGVPAAGVLPFGYPEAPGWRYAAGAVDGSAAGAEPVFAAAHALHVAASATKRVPRRTAQLVIRRPCPASAG